MSEEKVECITDQERELAQTAFIEFQAKNFSACLQNIAKLDAKKDDFKVIHNKYLTEYCRSDFKKTSQFHKNLISLLQQFGLSIDKPDDVEYCVAYFNIGILYYQQRQHTKALRIIERIYKFIEPLDEMLGRQVGLLLIELHICMKQVDKALSLITYFLNQITSLTNANKEKTRDKQNDRFTKALERYRVRCHLLSHSLKAASIDIKLLHEPNENDVEILYLLANQLYLEGKFKQSMKTLGNIPADVLKYNNSGQSSNVLFYNNIGAIHHAMGKHNLACHYYQQALQEEQQHLKNPPTSSLSDETSLFALGASRHHELMLNLGIALLHAGKPTQAFECLVIAVRKYHRDSRLWLRLAECCIQAHKPTNATDFDIHRKQKELIVDVLGVREMQKVILNDRFTRDKKYSAESQSYAVPVATLEFATLCLKNAEFLLEADAGGVAPLLLIPGVSLPPTTTTTTVLPNDDRQHLKNSILVAYAYISLCLGDYVIALDKARELLKQPKMSGAHKLLGNLYAAEAFVLLDKLNDALEHLRPEIIKDIGLECPGGEEEDEIPTRTSPPVAWFPETLQSAIAVMQYNVAVIQAMRGQFLQAATLLNKVWQGQTPESKVPAQIIMLVLYIKIQLGHVDIAKTFIRQYSIQRRISG